jgi:hypothetical protein
MCHGSPLVLQDVSVADDCWHGRYLRAYSCLFVTTSKLCQVSLIVYSSFDLTALDPVDSVRGQDGPDVGCQEWAHGGCQGSDRERCRYEGHGEGLLRKYPVRITYYGKIQPSDRQIHFFFHLAIHYLPHTKHPAWFDFDLWPAAGKSSLALGCY